MPFKKKDEPKPEVPEQGKEVAPEPEVPDTSGAGPANPVKDDPKPPEPVVSKEFTTDAGWSKLKLFALKHRETPCASKHKSVGNLLTDFIARVEAGYPTVEDLEKGLEG